MQSRYPPQGMGGPTREIRMVYHNHHGGSRVSIFSHNARDQSYYNPITHQRTHYQAGSQYHLRQQQQPPRMPHPHPHVQQSGQRRRMQPGGWY